jgi:hypothetical protein
MAELNEVIILNEKQKYIINTNLNKDEKLTCVNAMNIAKSLNLKTIQMSDACKNIDVKITNCELGVFGKLNFDTYDENIYKEISLKLKDNKDVSCAKLWNISKNTSLEEVGSTVKNSDIEVITCQLGCFSQRKGYRKSKKDQFHLLQKELE